MSKRKKRKKRSQGSGVRSQKSEVRSQRSEVDSLKPIDPSERTQKLSVCMIARNEEKVIRRALNSVKDIADEIIVTDTGSTDNTVAVAKECGAKTSFFEWNDHFADARNYSMNQATGDWILIMDADEELYASDRWKLHALIEKAEIDSIAILLRNLFPCPEAQTDESLPNIEKYRHTTNHLPRLLRNKPTIRYHRRIHEDISPDSIPPKRRYISDVSLYHYGYCYKDDRKERRAKRNKRLTELYLQENPTDPTSHYYVGSTRLAAGLADSSNECFKKVLEHAPVENDTYLHFRLMALFHLSRNAALRGDYKAEEKYSVEAIIIAPEYLDAWLRVGESFFYQDKFWMAERAFHRYRKLLHDYQKNTPKTRYTLFQLGMDHMACYHLGRLAEFRFDFDRAKTFYQKSIELDASRSSMAHFYLANIYSRERNYHKMDAHLYQALKLDPQGIKERLKKPVELPATDKSEMGGSCKRDENSRPDPTSVYAATLTKPIKLAGVAKKKNNSQETKPTETVSSNKSKTQPSETSPFPATTDIPALRWYGPFLETGNWAENSRHLLDAACAGKFDLYLQTSTKEIDPNVPITDEWIEELRHLTHRIVPGTKDYVRIWDAPLDQISKPDSRARWNIARIDWPTDRLPENWVEKCKVFDQVWVPSSHHRKILLDAGVSSDQIRILPGAVDTESFSPDREISALEINSQDKFNFLAVFDWNETQAWKLLLKTYLATFKLDEDVTLILRPCLPPGKTNTQVEAELVSFLKEEGIDLVKSPAVILLAHRLPFEEMAKLYRAADAFVLPGYSAAATPHYLEAMAMGLPVIATRWGAHLDYLNDSNAFLVNVEKFESLSNKDQDQTSKPNRHQWAVPSESHLKEIFRHAFSNPAEARAIGCSARETAVKELGLRSAVTRMINHLRDLSSGNEATSGTNTKSSEKAKPKTSKKKEEVESLIKASSTSCNVPAPIRAKVSLTKAPSYEQLDAKIFQDCTRVLDINCERSAFLEALKSLGIHGIGLSQSAEDIQSCQARQLDVQQATLSDLKAQKNRFDGIYARYVIEQFDGPGVKNFLKTLLQLLKPNGKLTIRTCSWENPLNKISHFRKDSHVEHAVEFLVPLMVNVGYEVTYLGEDGDNSNDLLIVAHHPTVRPSASKSKPVILWYGAQFRCHSLALVNRSYCRSLLKEMDVELNLELFDDVFFEGGSHPGNHLDLLQRSNRKPSRDVDLTITHSFPPSFEAAPTGHWVHILPWEYGSIIEDWYTHLNERVDEIWVYSNHTKEGIIGDGIDPEKVFVMPLSFDTELFNHRVEPSSMLDGLTQKNFKFLFCGGTLERKGIDILLDAYVQAFRRSDDVCLVIKDMGNKQLYKGTNFEDVIQEILSDPEAPEIVYITDMMLPQEIAALYRACNALVHPYRGEGFGLPVAEAMACGLPVIISQGGACDDFCPIEDTFWVNAPTETVRIEGYNTVRKSYWLQPSTESLIEQMHLAASNPEETAARGERSRQHITQVLSWGETGKLMAERIQKVREKPILRPTAKPSRLSIPEPVIAAPKKRRQKRKKRKKAGSRR